MTDISTDSPESIIKRLEKLRKWQEDQQKILIERQSAQRTMLGLEQQKMYEMLGLSPIAKEDEPEPPQEAQENHYFKNSINNFGESNSDLLKKPNKLISNEYLGMNNQIIPKKFLRRGEGLKTRFKIDPNSFRLHNLPKYKYAINKKFLEKEKNTNKKDIKKITSESPVDSKVQLNMNKIKLLRPLKLTNKVQEAEENESICESYSATQEFCYIKSQDLENNNQPSCSKEKMDIPENLPPSWAKVLDPNQIKPLAIEQFRKNYSNMSESNVELNDSENLSIFELLERKAAEGSFNFNASIIQKWIEEKAKELIDETKDAGIVTDNVRNNRISPFPCDIDEKILPEESNESENNSLNNSVTSTDSNSSDCYAKGRSLNNKRDSVPEQCHVRFSEEVQINHVNDSDNETVLSNDIDCPISNTIETESVNLKLSKQNLEFEQFKAQLFATTNDSASMDDTSLIKQIMAVPLNNDENRNEMIEKTELLKNRLTDLENEISTFRNHSTELIKLKQQHELDKIQLEQERIEMQEKFNDEKIKFEIHLHDERMKLEDEKIKLDKIIKDQRNPNRKEREEITKLKYEVENLQKELKNKESKHVTAQSRLRAQFRNFEKEIKDLSFELDHLKKENKKLETENTKLTRQSNNKMLQEINKTIAKLAPKPVEDPIVSEVRNKNHKPVIAKIISHKRQPSTSKKSTYKILNNFSQDEENSDKFSIDSTSEDDEIQIQNKKTTASSSRNSIKETRKSLENKNPENQSPSSNNTNFTKEFKREIQNSDGSKDIWYPNGNLKKISSDGMNIKMLYFNKDIKETNISEGTVRYYYAEKNTWHTTYLDGLEILEFPNGQTEHRYKDGTVEVHFQNGSIRISNPSDQHKAEEWRYADGTNLLQLKNGDKILSLPNGQKEIHTKIHKRREYPDGTVKLVYPDGSQETRYSNGRVRLKDKDGNLVMDSENIKY